MHKDMTYDEYRHEVKEGILTEAGNCPVTPLLQILYELFIQDPIRFGELKKNINGITNTMLASSLRELEKDGLVSRMQFNEIPPRVEYSLTEKGQALLPVFYEMTKWGFQYIP